MNIMNTPKPFKGYAALSRAEPLLSFAYSPGPLGAEQVEIATKYAGYIERQNEQIARDAGQDTLRLPSDIDYRTVRGLSNEIQQKLNEFRPETLGHAARISGMTPAAIALLLVHLKRGFRQAVPEVQQRSA